jgi:hypothetical protein
MSKFKYFTLLAEYPSEVDGKPTIYFGTKSITRIMYRTVTISPPKWAKMEDGYVANEFWPSDAGGLWLSEKMKEFSNQIAGAEYDYYYPTDNIEDYHFQ